MNAKKSLTMIGQAVPELPVEDVERSQQHYRELGFEIAWLYQAKRLGPCHGKSGDILSETNSTV